MGGPGSGNWYRWDKKSVTLEHKRLDIRLLKKQNGLKPGTLASISWSSNGESTGSIGYEIKENRMVLKYQHRKKEQDWEEVIEIVFFDQTRCHFGGYRTWFLCPKCERRVAILYGPGKYFLCRHCSNLTYESCNTNSVQRIFDKAYKLKKQLGGKSGLDYPIPEKPKGMHWKTYNRIKHEIIRLEMLGDEAMFKKWGR